MARRQAKRRKQKSKARMQLPAIRIGRIVAPVIAAGIVFATYQLSIALLDRPISDPDGPADSIRQPVVAPDRDVRPFQDVLIDLGGRLGLPGFVEADGAVKYPGGYSDYMVNHERAPGVGPLFGWRGEKGEEFGRGAPNPEQLQRYIDNGCFYFQELEPHQRFFKHANKGYLDWARSVGFLGTADQIVFQLYSEPLQRFRLAARGHGEVTPPLHHRRKC